MKDKGQKTAEELQEIINGLDKMLEQVTNRNHTLERENAKLREGIENLKIFIKIGELLRYEKEHIRNIR